MDVLQYEPTVEALTAMRALFVIKNPDLVVIPFNKEGSDSMEFRAYSTLKRITLYKSAQIRNSYIELYRINKEDAMLNIDRILKTGFNINMKDVTPGLLAKWLHFTEQLSLYYKILGETPTDVHFLLRMVYGDEKTMGPCIREVEDEYLKALDYTRIEFDRGWSLRK